MYERYPADPLSTEAALVRNPSWSRETDPRRGAWADRIEIGVVSDPSNPFADIESGSFDFYVGAAPGAVVNRYRADPGLVGRLRSTASESIWWIPMNLAVPPFDDPAVRRAVNAVVNRAAVTDIVLAARTANRGPQSNPLLIDHVFPDSLTDGLLIDYEPFATRGNTGDLALARLEMSASRYDADGDGLCDAPVCSGIAMPAEDPALGEAVRADLARVGIAVAVVPFDDFPTPMELPTTRTAIQVVVSLWGFSLSGQDLAGLLRGGPDFRGPEFGTPNTSLVGAPADALAEWGYSVTEVPSVDDIIDDCEMQTGHLRARCWAGLDQVVSEVIVPWVPIFSLERAHISSARVATFDIDQSISFPALDNVVVAHDQ